MSMMGGMFSGAKGTAFQGGTADIQQPVTQEQVKQAYENSQQGLRQQQDLITALQGQGGIQKQTDVYGQLAGLAAGTGPSLAQTQLQQSTGANVANQAALMAGQRGAGANTGLMARQAAQQGAGIQQGAAGQMAQLKAQEQLGAIGQMGGLATQMVGQQSGAVGNYNQYAQNEQSQLLNSIAQANAARVNMQGNVNSSNAHIAGINAKAQADMVAGAMAGMSSGSGMMGGGGGGGGGGGSSASSGAGSMGMLAMMSDERAKKNIKPGDTDAKAFMDKLQPKGYDYKDPANGQGHQLGVMAQDMEKAAPNLVKETPEGKMIDYSQAGGHLMASIGDLNARLKALEGKGGSKKKYAEGGEAQPEVEEAATAHGEGPVPAPPPQGMRSLGANETVLDQEPSSGSSGPASFIGKLFGGIFSSPATASGSGAIPSGSGSIPPTQEQQPNQPNQANTQQMPDEDAGESKMYKAAKGMFGGSDDSKKGGARGGRVPVTGPQLAAQGKLVPGKAKVKGNSYANDTVDAKLSPGEVIIPRSVMQSKDPINGAAAFVQAIMAKNGLKKKVK